MKRLNIGKISEILIAPIIPLLIGVFYILNLYIEIKLISIVLTIIICVIFIIIGQFLAINYRKVYSFFILSLEWFILDILNIVSSNQYVEMKPSILESVIKNTMVFVV